MEPLIAVVGATGTGKSKVRKREGSPEKFFANDCR
jgi:hypothetical protein